jgi:branched-chain amino acid transport system permease protein
MSAFLTQLINGISIGSMYAMVAIGYTLVVGVLNMLNFAHHEVFMVACYLALWAFMLSHFPPWLSTVVAVLGAGILGILTNFICFRRIERTSHLAPLVSSIAFGSILASAIPLYWGSEPYRFIPLLSSSSINIGSVHIDPTTLVIIIVVGICVSLLELLLLRTRMGRAIRAVAVNPDIASLMGINAKWIVTVVFLITGVLAGICSILFGMKMTTINPGIGKWFALTGLAVMVIGGLGNFRGAIWAGLIVGVCESLVIGYGPTRVAHTVAWIILIVVLAVKKGGLFASMTRE